MRILFDHGSPLPLRDYLPEHAVDPAADRGWSELSNGELLDRADGEGCQVLITTDQGMRYQQNVATWCVAPCEQV